MRAIHSIESVHVSGGVVGPWPTIYNSMVQKPGAGGGSSDGGTGGSVPSGPGVNVRPTPGSGAYQPVVPGGEVNDGMG